MSEIRKLAAILVSDVVGYSRLTGASEERILARKRTGDGSIVEFRSVVDAVRCAIEVQTGMVERNARVRPERLSTCSDRPAGGRIRSLVAPRSSPSSARRRR
jgi:class 3 adenylate cyclase